MPVSSLHLISRYAGTSDENDPVLSLPYKTDDFDEILEHADRIAAHGDLVVDQRPGDIRHDGNRIGITLPG